MRRRDFMSLFCGAATWSVGARAQQGERKVRIGFLSTARRVEENYQTFMARLRELGFNEAQNLIVEYRALDDPRGAFASAAELMRLQPDLIVVTGPEVALQAVVGASRAIPIVFLAIQYDPVERGYVASLARPGGNITGVFLRQPELAAKQLEILTQAFPERNRLAVLWDGSTAEQFSVAEQSAHSLRVKLLSFKLESPPYDFDAAFRNMGAEAAQMVLVLSSPFFTAQRPQIAALAIEHRLPTMFVFRTYVDAGGLMSYSVDFPATFRRIAEYVARILNGSKPADLPIEQPAKFELVINLRTAKALGLEIPPTLLARADEVIE
jgi:putative ABC transport system substrate-binding protein